MTDARLHRESLEVLIKSVGTARSHREGLEVLLKTVGPARLHREGVEVLLKSVGAARSHREGLEVLMPNGGINTQFAWGTPLVLAPTFPAGLILDWQAGVSPAFQTAGGAAAVADNDPVGVWRDSINAKDAVQATAGQRPLLKKSVYNGLDALRFDGSNDQLLVPGSALDQVPNMTLFLVFKSSGAGGRVIIGKNHNASGWSSPYCRWILYNDGSYNTRWNGNALSGGSWSTGDLKVLEFVDADVYANGTKVVDGTDADLTYPNGNTPIHISGNGVGSEYGFGDYCRIMMWNRSLDATERSVARSILGNQYAVTVV